MGSCYMMLTVILSHYINWALETFYMCIINDLFGFDT